MECKFNVTIGNKSGVKQEYTFEEFKEEFRETALALLLHKINLKPNEEISTQQKEEIEKIFLEKTVKNAELKDFLETLDEDTRRELTSFGIHSTLDTVENTSNTAVSTIMEGYIEDPFKIQGISTLEQIALEEFLSQEVLRKISIAEGKISSSSIRDILGTIVNDSLQPQIDKLKNLQNKIEAQSGGNLFSSLVYDIIEEKIRVLETAIAQQEKLVNTKEGFLGSVSSNITSFLSFDLTEEASEVGENEEVFDLYEVEEQKEIFNQASFEKDFVATFSSSILLSLAGVPKTLSNGSVMTGEFGETLYHNPLDILEKMMAVTTSIASSKEELLSRLEELGKKDPVYQVLHERLSEKDSQVINEILYKMVRDTLSMKMVLYSSWVKEERSEEETFKTETYSAQILEVIKKNSYKILEDWKEGLQSSTLMLKTSEGASYSKVVADTLRGNILQLQKDFKTARKEKDAVERKKLMDTAINKYRKTLSQIGVRVTNEELGVYLDLQKEYPEQNNSLLGKILQSLNQIVLKEEGYTFEEEVIFKNINSKIKSLAATQENTGGLSITRTERVGGKSIQATVNNTMAGEQLKKLKSIEALSEKIQIPFMRNSLLLNLLMEDEGTRENYGFSYGSLDFFKKQGTNSSRERGVTDLGGSDYTLAEIAMMTSATKVGIERGGVFFNWAYSMSPTISDKGRTLLFNVPQLNLSMGVAPYSADLPVTEILTEDHMDFLVSQIFSPELGRIVQSLMLKKIAKEEDKHSPTEIEFYEEASEYFNILPGLNDIEIGEEKVNILKLIQEAVAQNTEEGEQEVSEKILQAVQGEVGNFLKEYFQYKVEETIGTENSTGVWETMGIVTGTVGAKKLVGVDSSYVNSRGGGNQATEKVALEYHINTLLGKIYQLQGFMGDPAHFAKNKKAIVKDSVGNIIAEESNFIASAEGFLDNFTKRAAMLIAPGNQLANSEGKNYMQIIVNDNVMMSDTIEEIIRLHYGETALTSRVKNLISNVRAKEIKTSDAIKNKVAKEKKESSLKELKSMFPNIQAFMALEGTDAQEYTTWREHLNTLINKGELSEKEKKQVQEAFETLSKGGTIENEEVLNLIMQPIKPVYAGTTIVYGQNNGVEVPLFEEVTYLKSSSFPLLPQLTQGLKLDRIRQKMENLESYAAKNFTHDSIEGVRLCYGTAAKIGGSPNAFNLEELYAEGDFKKEDIQRVKVLARSNFRVQQETNYKTNKNNSKGKMDEVTQGSQMWKSVGATLKEFENDRIFPNSFPKHYLDILNIPVQDFLTGKEMTLLKNFAENGIIDAQEEALLEELGFTRNSEGVLEEGEDLVKNLHQLLVREFKEKGAPNITIQEMSLKEVAGLSAFEFPIWLASSSNKIEALINGIITKRMVALTLPGNAHIVGSSEGFEILGDEFLSKEADPKLRENVYHSLSPEERREVKYRLAEELEILKEEKRFLEARRDGKEETLKDKIYRYIVNTSGKNTDYSKIISRSDVLKQTGYSSKELPKGTWTHLKGEMSLESFADKILEAEGIDESSKGAVESMRNLVIEYFKDPNTFKSKTARDAYFKEELDSINQEIQDIDKELTAVATPNTPNASRIVWRAGHKGKRLKATTNEEGKLISAEVLIQSKFTYEVVDEKGKKSLKKVDFTKEPYSYVDDKGFLVLNEEMIDKELLEMVSYRIPYSSLQSGAMLKVVGFLPEGSADLLVVPQDHTAQIGEDFDVDKRNVYKSHFKYDEATGEINKLSKEYYSLTKLANSKGLSDVFLIKEILNTEEFTSLKKEVEFSEDCFGNKAEYGARGNFTTGGKWELIKDLEGYPSHKKGGVDIKLGKGVINVGGKEIKAENGLLVPGTGADNTPKLDTLKNKKDGEK